MTNRTPHTAADYHALGLSCVPILPRTKRPPAGFNLRTFLKRPATSAEIGRWFGDGKMNIAAVLGNVSNGVTVRDFDVEASYLHWAGDYPRLAETLPTARTPRGYHVFFTCDADDVHDVGNGGDIICGDDGELKHGGYVLLAESVHPCGKTYKWVRSPEDWPFVSDLNRAGLLPKKGRGTHTNKSNTGAAVWDGKEIPVTVAIESSQPTGYGQRHDQILRFACLLKMTELANSSLSAVKPAFEEWHRLARPRIRTKQFLLSWLDFAEC